MRKKRKTRLIILAIILVVVGYKFFRDYRIGSRDWKACGGEAIVGDFPSFDYNFFHLDNDTLYQNGQPVALRIDYQHRLSDDVLDVASLDGKLKGRYCSK